MRFQYFSHMRIIYKQDPQTKTLILVYRFDWLNAIEMVKQQCIVTNLISSKNLNAQIPHSRHYAHHSSDLCTIFNAIYIYIYIYLA
jgi:hypothetical protein